LIFPLSPLLLFPHVLLSLHISHIPILPFF
jgi:hypothetical protein